MSTRPNLHEIPLQDVWPINPEKMPGVTFATMSQGQWDGLLESAYLNGAILIELDPNEIPLRAYRLPQKES